MTIFNESSADAWQDREDEAINEYVEKNKEDIAYEFFSDDDNLKKYLKLFMENIKKAIKEIEEDDKYKPQ